MEGDAAWTRSGRPLSDVQAHDHSDPEAGGQF